MNWARTMIAAALVGVLTLTTARADEVGVERRRGSAVGTIARNTVGGAVLGSAVSGGIILYRMGIEDESDYDWQETLLWGALIGAGAGLVLGVVDVASGPSYELQRSPVRDGSSLTLDLRRRDHSQRQLVPLLSRRF